MPAHKRPIRERFEQKVRVTPGCWLWTGGQTIAGYGNIWLNGKHALAHRVSYRLYVGEIPSGLIIRHKCDNPCCVNPDHLEPGTYTDNARDRKERNRQDDRRGEKNSFSFLTEDQVRSMRSDGRSSRSIAADYGVDKTTVANIKLRRTWSHI